MTKKKPVLKTSVRESESQDAYARDVYAQAIRKVQLAHRWRAADGRSAFGELNRYAYGDEKGRDPRKLSIEDAAVLAAKLYEFLQEVAPRLKDLGVSRGELCRRAGLCGRITEKSATGPEDAKELYRLTLPPGVDARKRGIRVSAVKYLNLIEVLATVLSDNVELVADRLLRGTGLHLMSHTAGEWSDMDLVQGQLQRMVNDLDRDFDLMKSFRQTAELKSKWIAEGSLEGWPLWESSDLYVDGDDGHLDAYRAERIAAADPTQAFYRHNKYFGRRNTGWGWWLYGFETRALQNDEFFYIPHAPVGHVLMWDLPDRHQDRAAYEVAVHQQVQRIRCQPENLALPDDDWDQAERCPTGQTGKRTGNWRLQDVFWLLAYPHPDGKRLVPTLYQAGEEGGAYMLPLDMDALDMLSDAVWVSPTQHRTVIDRLIELLVDVGEDGLNPIERSMRRTAAWLVDNPVLKQQREREQRSRRLGEVFRSEGRPVTGRQSKK